ncbi:HNH endonuclease [Nocardioides sp.]|uniref:HNH endonuclease n=1 Tax=Nocardioides sp. TaxID=35761 RepID=UPI0039E2BBDB
MDSDLRESIYARAGGNCDRCGVAMHPDAWECHHRKLRSRGGEDSHENLVALCPGCHRWVHREPIIATAHGLIVPSWADPAERPVLRHGRAFWLPIGPHWVAPHEVKDHPFRSEP